jgi:hypothetical protein
MASEIDEITAEDPFEDERNAKPWDELIKDASEAAQQYHDKCDNIEERYGDLEKLASISREREFQIFWANIEVIKPSIYARPPIPVVAGRFKGHKGPRKELVRHASELLERSLIASFDAEDIDETMKLVRDDLAVVGRGVMWLRYDTERGESVKYDHVDRKDFLHDPARKWKEVGWCARRSWLSREQMRERFEDVSDDAWTQAEYQERDNGKQDDFKGEKKAAVWEIWHKAKNLVVWVTPGAEDVLDIQEPFLELEGFYPCPKPAYATCRANTLTPIPDFLYYKDQIEEINQMTARIAALGEALRVKGFYAGGNEDIGDAIESALKQTDNTAILIPVPNFAALGGGGMKDAIVWLPIDQIAATVQGLIQLRRQLIDDVYQITGISDIMRGETQASETLGAQQLKSQYGSVRIRSRQEAIIKVARDATRIAGEIMAENFDPATLMAMSQYDQEMQPDPADMQQGVVGVTPDLVFNFLRDQRIRPFVLDIETDSTIVPDEDAVKKRSTEFLGALATALSQLAPMVAQQPESAPFAAEVLKFAIAPFRGGRPLEASVDEFSEMMKGVAQQPKPNPEAERMQAEGQAKQAEMQLRAQEGQANQQAKQMEMKFKMEETAEKLKLDMRKLDLEERKIDLEEAKYEGELSRLTREFNERDVDRDINREDAMIGAGIPPDFSFERERETTKALVEAVNEDREQLTRAVDAMVDQGEAVVGAVNEIQETLAQPKRLVKDTKTGEILGVQVGDKFQPVTRDADGDVSGLAPLN